MSKAKQLKIKLIRSTIGRSKRHSLSVKALGLKRIGDYVILANNLPTNGLIKQVGYLLEVEEVVE